jgi:hypothetical protein
MTSGLGGWQGLPGDSHHCGKRFGIAHGKISQDLAVDSHSGNRESLDQAVVWEAIQSAGSVDPLNPEPAHVAFTVTAIAIGILQRPHHRFVSALVQPVSRTAMTLDLQKDFSMPAMSRNTTLDTSHVFVSLLR